MTVNETLLHKLKEIFFMCPECKGEGGERDVILDDGSGPWYRCGFCEGKGYMNVFKKMYWKILFGYYKWQEKCIKAEVDYERRD